MWPPKRSGRRLDAVPMPPFQPKATVPVPAPTEPSATGPPVADRMAATTCSRRTGRERMSLRAHPSFVSPTRAFTERTSPLPGWARVHATTASTAVPTARVFVRTIGVSIVPSSRTWVEPASFPKALPTKTAPGTFSWKRFPPCGSTAVTPVRMVSPSRSVTWPTRTPATSVMAFRGPGGKTPGARPRSRARGRGSGSPHSTARARYSASGSCTRTGRAAGSSQRSSRSIGSGSKAVQPEVVASGPERRCRKMQLPPPEATGASLWPTHTTRR